MNQHLPSPATHIPARPPRTLRGVSKQWEAFLKTADEPNFCLALEQRCGKSWVAINTADYQYTKYHNDQNTGVNGILIVAMPGRVHRNWTTQELPLDLAVSFSSVTWEAGKANSKYFKIDLANLLATPALAVLAINGEAVLTEAFRAYIAAFLKARRRVMVIADECFVAGTLITTKYASPAPIEALRQGDLILTSSGYRPIRRVFEGWSEEIVKITFQDGRTITCTKNHPIFTDLGWVTAENLAGRKVRILPEDFQTKAEQESKVLQLLLRGTYQESISTPRRNDEVHMVQGKISTALFNTTSENDQILREILLSEVEDDSARSAGQSIFPRGDGETSRKTSGNAYMAEQAAPSGYAWEAGMALRPSVARSNERENSRKPQSQWAYNKNTWWERAWHDEGAGGTKEDPRFELAPGIRHRIGRKAAWLSNLLQGRFSLAETSDRSRDRREFTQQLCQEGKGQEEKQNVAELRVESVEAAKCGSPQTVYNLEVEGCPHYFANGVLVHNSDLLMKTPGAKRTKLMRIISRQPQVVMKRILTGTPMETPLDLYSQFAFLDPAILGHTSFTSYKHRYAKWKRETAWSTGQTYETLDRGPDNNQSPWQNLEELQQRMAKKTFRALRSECFDVHDKTYQIATFVMTPKQRRVYDALSEELEAELPSGRQVSVKHVLTRYLRLQQIASGFFPSERLAIIHPPCNGEGCEACDDLGVVVGFTPLEYIDTTNPRLDTFAGIIERNASDQIVTWARFHEDVDACMRRLTEMGRRPVQYDGRCSPLEKDAALNAYQAGLASDLVGNPRSGGRGIKLSKAKLIINYSNEFALLTRLQSEDRAEAPDRSFGTGIVDIASENSIDDKVIIPALRAKKNIYDFVMQERSGKWL